MTENPHAAVPSEPTTPADELRGALANHKARHHAQDDDDPRAWMMYDCVWQDAALAKALTADFLARGEVGPSPEQIDAAAKAMCAEDDKLWPSEDSPRQRYYLRIAKAALVAACSVRGSETQTNEGYWLSDDGPDGSLDATTTEALLAVAHAAWHLMDDSGELDTTDDAGRRDYMHMGLNHERLSTALDALEATGWDAHPELCARCGGEGTIERVATPEEVDAGCELGVAFDPCPDCTR